ncbi:MAG: rod shape-determining protein MreC, partial [Candidatus Sumerlaeota bacterium]|nr:rod shape-determining protein MreC [Candidatus Sumerlaeota bacterium]
MAKPPEEPRAPRRSILVLLIIAAFALMIVQMRSPERVSTAGRWTLTVFTPLFQAGAWSSERLRSTLEWAVSAEAALESNRQLQRENTELQVQARMLSERIKKLERESQLTRSPSPEPNLVFHYADVKALSSQQWVHSIIVDQGKIQGVHKAMPVVDYSGALVGQVVEVAPESAVVLLVTDPNFHMGAMIADNPDFSPGSMNAVNASRERGMLTGLGDPNAPLRFRPEEPQKPLRVNSEVISSGFEDSIYPKGLLIGTITQVTRDKYGMQYADVQPAASFESLEEVILIDAETLRRVPAGAAEPRPLPASLPTGSAGGAGATPAGLATSGLLDVEGAEPIPQATPAGAEPTAAP